MKKLIPFAIAGILSINGYAQCYQSATAPVKGVINIEAESAKQVEGWTEHDNGTMGDGAYLEWTGEDHFKEVGIGTMNYSIHIQEPGTYKFLWHCKVGLGDSPTDSNDSWLRFPDASATFAVQASSKDTIRPHGICTDDCPEGAGADGWYKVFSSSTTDWTWTGRTSDNHGHQVYVVYDEPGVYIIQISARSNGHCIDKMVMFPEYLSLKDALLR